MSSRVISFVFFVGLLMLSSCKPKRSKEVSEVQQHFNKIEESEASLKAKIEAQFRDTPYQLEVNSTLMGEPLKEGAVSSNDLKAMKFGYLVFVTGADTDEKMREVKSELREAVNQEELESMKIFFETGEKNGVKQFRNHH